MHVLVMSDMHIGWDKANEDAFEQFITDDILSIDPDKVVLAGDIIEMWRRGMSSILAEKSKHLANIANLHDSGIDVVLLAGNHDWRFIESDAEGSVISEEPWQFEERFDFTSGDREFTVVHGHQGDPFNDSNPQNESLCLTDDETSNAINSLYESVIKKSFALDALSKRAPIVSRPNLGSLQSLSQPGFLSQPDYSDVKKFVVDKLTRTYDNFVIAGHTHIAEVQDDYANCGSWTGINNTYIEVEDGKLELKEWEL